MESIRLVEHCGAPPEITVQTAPSPVNILHSALITKSQEMSCDISKTTTEMRTAIPSGGVLISQKAANPTTHQY